MISPTIGRVVLFHPAPNRLGARPAQPWPALVAFVHHDRSVNLGGFMHNGEPFSATNVPLLQDDDVASEGDAYAEWMPYQRGQAAKTDSLDELSRRLQVVELYCRAHLFPNGLPDAVDHPAIEGADAAA